MAEFKQINLKELNKSQQSIIRHINQQILEHQQMFALQPDELVINKKDYLLLSEDPDNLNDYKYLTLGNKNIKIYSI